MNTDSLNKPDPMAKYIDKILNEIGAYFYWEGIDFDEERLDYKKEFLPKIEAYTTNKIIEARIDELALVEDNVIHNQLQELQKYIDNRFKALNHRKELS